MTPETRILNEIRADLGREKDLVLWRLNQGAGVMVPRDALDRLASVLTLASALAGGKLASLLDEAGVILRDITERNYNRFGLPKGAPDLVGIIGAQDTTGSVCVPATGIASGTGRWVGIEVKSATGRLSPEQSQFGRVIESRGGFWTMARSVTQAREFVERCRAIIRR